MYIHLYMLKGCSFLACIVNTGESSVSGGPVPTRGTHVPQAESLGAPPPCLGRGVVSF